MPELFSGTKGTFNGLYSNESFSKVNDRTYTLKSADYTMNFVYRYESFPRQYKSAINVGSGKTSTTISRAIPSSDTGTNTWYYVTSYNSTGTCNSLGDIVSAPCGFDVYADPLVSNYYVEINLRAMNTNGLRRADEIIKQMNLQRP